MSLFYDPLAWEEFEHLLRFIFVYTELSICLVCFLLDFSSLLKKKICLCLSSVGIKGVQHHVFLPSCNYYFSLSHYKHTHTYLH